MHFVFTYIYPINMHSKHNIFYNLLYNKVELIRNRL